MEDKREMKRSILISVIIPVYNREKEIRNCLNELAQTTFDKEHLEVLVVDDASTDNTVEEANQFQDRFCHFHLIKLAKNSGGASVPRNTALKQAKGKWLLFIDSDDYVTAHALAECYQLAEQDKNTDLVCMPYFREKDGNRAISRSCFTYKEPIDKLDFTDTKLYNSLNIVGKLIRRECLERYKINFPEKIRVREDNYFSMKLYAIVNKVAFLGNKKNYYYCGEKDAVSLSQKGTPPRDAVKIYISVFKFVFELETISQEKKEDILSIFLNRYFELIKRGEYSPVRLLNETRPYLFTLTKSKYLRDETRQFLKELSLRAEVKVNGISFFQKKLSLQENCHRSDIVFDEKVKKIIQKGKITTSLSSTSGRFKLNQDFIIVDRDAVIEPYTTFARGNHFYTMGSFSYSQSNLPINTIVGRYSSIAKDVSRFQGSDLTTRFTTSNVTDEANTPAIKWFLKDYHKEFSTKLNESIDDLPIVIGNDVWIGPGVCFSSKGITVGDGAVIAAGSMVVKDIPPYAVVAGVPAKVVNYRFNSHVIEQLLNLKWWQYAWTDFRSIQRNESIENFIDSLEEMITKEKLWPYLPDVTTCESFGI